MHEKQSIWKKLISRTLGNKKTQSVTIPVFCVLIGLIAGAVVIAVLGKNPFSAYYNLLQGCGLAPKASYAGYKSILTDFLSFLNYLTPMIFAALAVAVAMRTGLFNIGVSGQMLAAGFLIIYFISEKEIRLFILNSDRLQRTERGSVKASGAAYRYPGGRIGGRPYRPAEI